jgi:tetratricopeptide (TPR) repeat protein
VADSPRIEELKRRVQSDPASIAFAALAEEYRRAERFEEAIAACTAGLVRHPSYLSAHVTLGRALIEVGRLEDAREELEYVLKLAPENLAAIRGLAEIHHRIGQDATEHSQPEPVAAAASGVDSMTIAEIQAASGASSPEPPGEDPPLPAEDVRTDTPQVSPADSDRIRPYSEEPSHSEAPPWSAPDVSHIETLEAAHTPSSEAHSAPTDPALTGLEELLSAVHRARDAAAR